MEAGIVDLIVGLDVIGDKIFKSDVIRVEVDALDFVEFRSTCCWS